MSLFDNCCLNTTAKYHIRNQKVKRNLLINIFLFTLYILNARFGKEIIYTYIILIHHLGMGPVIQQSYANLSWKCPNIMAIRQCILRCGPLIYFISGQSKKVKTEQEIKKIKIKANAILEQYIFDDERRKTKVSKTLEESHHRTEDTKATNVHRFQ